MNSKCTLLTVAALVVAGAACVLVVQHRSILRLRENNASLSTELAAAQRLLNAPSRADADAEELLRLRGQERELIRLRGEVTLLRHERNSLSDQLAAASAKELIAPAPTQSSTTQNVDSVWVQQMLSAPLTQQGLSAGSLRGRLLRGERGTSSEVTFRDALEERQLNQTLERTPADFADFQTGFIQGAVGITDATTLQHIHDLIEKTYEHAVANGLDVSSKPVTGADEWVQQRFQLDRRATAAVEQLFTPEERKMFGRAFIGVMGVDLGDGRVDKSNYPKGFLGP